MHHVIALLFNPDLVLRRRTCVLVRIHQCMFATEKPKDHIEQIENIQSNFQIYQSPALAEYVDMWGWGPWAESHHMGFVLCKQS